MKLAIIGDYNASFRPHVATNEAVEQVKKFLNISLQVDWIATDTILSNLDFICKSYDGFWIAPGSPYKSMEGALKIIAYARENKVPTLGTCGGFQHIVIEFARNILQIKEATHAEYDPYASVLIVNPLSCSLVGERLDVTITDKESLTYKLVESDTLHEKYYCNFGLNPAYQSAIHAGGLKVVASDNTSEARILELAHHPFFIATLFVPQDNSTATNPHKIVVGFIKGLMYYAAHKPKP